MPPLHERNAWNRGEHRDGQQSRDIGRVADPWAEVGERYGADASDSESHDGAEDDQEPRWEARGTGRQLCVLRDLECRVGFRRPYGLELDDPKCQLLLAGGRRDRARTP